MFLACLLPFFLLFLAFSQPVLAQENLVINEFCALSSPDWVEIYNPLETTIDLEGWKIIDQANNSLNLSGSICPLSHRYFEFSNRLNNGGDEISLVNSNDEVVDKITYFDDLILVHQAGQSTGRYPDGANSWLVFDSPSPQDDPCSIISPTPTPSPTPTLTPTPNIDYENIFLNEVMVNPDSGSEWVELYNANNFTVQLVDWQIDDWPDSGSSSWHFSGLIEAGGYQTLTLNRAIFNNSGDQVSLLNTNGDLKDYFIYEKSVAGQTWGLFEENWCLQNPSPNQPNSGCFSTSTPTPTPTPTPTSLLEPKDQYQQGSVYGSSVIQTQTYPLNSYSAGQSLDENLNQDTLVYQSSGNWLPSWLLFSAGSVNFLLGAVSLLKLSKN